MSSATRCNLKAAEIETHIDEIFPVGVFDEFVLYLSPKPLADDDAPSSQSGNQSSRLYGFPFVQHLACQDGSTFTMTTVAESQRCILFDGINSSHSQSRL